MKTNTGKLNHITILSSTPEVIRDYHPRFDFEINMTEEGILIDAPSEMYQALIDVLSSLETFFRLCRIRQRAEEAKNHITSKIYRAEMEELARKENLDLLNNYEKLMRGLPNDPKVSRQVMRKIAEEQGLLCSTVFVGVALGKKERRRQQKEEKCRKQSPLVMPTK